MRPRPSPRAARVNPIAGRPSASGASLQEVHSLPFLIALASAVALAPGLLRALADGGHTRANFRDRPLPFPFGVLTPRPR